MYNIFRNIQYFFAIFLIFIKFLQKKFSHFLENSLSCCIFALRIAQMAESVDALVSNTSRAICAGSTPALGTKKPLYLFKVVFFMQCVYLVVPVSVFFSRAS